MVETTYIFFTKYFLKCNFLCIKIQVESSNFSGPTAYTITIMKIISNVAN